MAKHQRIRRRNAVVFERHRATGTTRDAGRNVRGDKAWQCLAAFRQYRPPQAPHFRSASGVTALIGKHIRHVEEPIRSDHGKTNM